MNAYGTIEKVDAFTALGKMSRGGYIGNETSIGKLNGILERCIKEEKAKRTYFTKIPIQENEAIYLKKLGVGIQVNCNNSILRKVSRFSRIIAFFIK